MKVVLFCGGLGLRIRDAEDIPKPMVQIGYRPILWHVMKYYAHFGSSTSSAPRPSKRCTAISMISGSPIVAGTVIGVTCGRTRVSRVGNGLQSGLYRE